MLTTHIKRNFFGVFLSFANFYLFLVMQFFYGFYGFCKFLWVSLKVIKAVKINDTSYISCWSSPKLAIGSLRLVRVETRPAAVNPPLLLSLQLQLLHVMDPFASVTLPCLGSIDVLVQRLVYVVALHPQLDREKSASIC